jgi:hypothetical protein
MTGIPRVVSVTPTKDKKLIVRFENNIEKLYDCAPLLGHPGFRSLDTPSGFAGVQVDAGGYAVVWNDTADISEYELWKKGTELVRTDDASQ